MKTVLFAAGKGGVGKTSLSLALAGECANLGLATGLRDLDPQAGATLMLGQAPVDDPWSGDPVRIERERTGVHFSLYRGGHQLANSRLPDLLRLLDSHAPALDILIVDAPPLLGDQTVAGLRRANLVVVPHLLTLSSLTGVAGIEQLSYSLGLMVPTRRVVMMPKDRRSISAEVRAFASENYSAVKPYTAEPPEDVAVVEAEAAGVPVTWLRQSRSARALARLTREILTDLDIHSVHRN